MKDVQLGSPTYVKIYLDALENGDFEKIYDIELLADVRYTQRGDKPRKPEDKKRPPGKKLTTWTCFLADLRQGPSPFPGTRQIVRRHAWLARGGEQ